MHDLSENSPREDYANESLRKYRSSSRREQERLRRAMEEQASWAREQQRIADEQRQAIERKLAAQRRKALGDNGSGGTVEKEPETFDFFKPDGPIYPLEKREIYSEFSEQFFFYSVNFSGQETPDCVLFVYSDVRDSTTASSLPEETEGLKSFVSSRQHSYLFLDDKPLAQYSPISYPVVLIIGLARGSHKLKIRQHRLPFLLVRELKLAFDLTEPGTYAVQLISRYLDDHRRTIFGEKRYAIYQPKFRRLD